MAIVTRSKPRQSKRSVHLPTPQVMSPSRDGLQNTLRPVHCIVDEERHRLGGCHRRIQSTLRMLREKYLRLAELDFLDAALSFHVMHEDEWGLDAHAEPVIT